MANDQNSIPSQATVLGTFDRGLLQRVEDAGLNASAPPQQLWMDGWLVRFNPGKAQRARCINAVAVGQGGALAGSGLQAEAIAAKLRRCEALYTERGLPMLLRITPFTQPVGLDAQLGAWGYRDFEDTRVMVGLLAIERAQRASASHQLPAGLEWARLDASAFAQAIGALRGSTVAACAAHAERLLAAPVPYVGWVVRQRASGQVMAAGQFAREAEWAGLYDVGVSASHQRQGLAQLLCERLLAEAGATGAEAAYLQVGADNEVARRLYARMGFVDAYSYHYRQAPTGLP
jgi:ribosomal protein S18 acetylase RimI-like enzyme